MEIFHNALMSVNSTHSTQSLLSSVIISNETNRRNLVLNLSATTGGYNYTWPIKCSNLSNYNVNCNDLNANTGHNGHHNQLNSNTNNHNNNRDYIDFDRFDDASVVAGADVDGSDLNRNLSEHLWHEKSHNNYWALLALILVFGTAAGNILVCLAIGWERRLQNVTNYFLMSLAITDLMVAILVMPLGILTLFVGYFPLHSEHCLVWICLDVLFCTASIMHLCTISVDRYLSLRYPMRFGRNKTRRRVTLKIIFVWLLSIAMSLPLSLMYSKNHASVLVNGTCQIPDPVYKLVGSIVCFYIPLGVMLLTYYLTVRLLARQQQNLGGTNPPTGGWASGWLGQVPGLERRCTWRRLLKTSHSSTPNHGHSATSTDTELSNLDNHELWLPDSSIPEPTPSTMTALHQFGAEMLKLSRGLESVSTSMASDSPAPSLRVPTPAAIRQQTSVESVMGPSSNENSHSHSGGKSAFGSATTGVKTTTGDTIQHETNHRLPKHQYEQQHMAMRHCNKIIHPNEHDNNSSHRSANVDESIQVKQIERHTSFYSSTHQKLMNFKKRRRASTSSPGKKYDSPGTPPPFYRKRFFSLPKNALRSAERQTSRASTACNNSTDVSSSENYDDNDSSYPNSLTLTENELPSSGKCLDSILKKSSRSPTRARNHMQFQQPQPTHCFDKNRHMADSKDFLQLPPPCTCPYFGDVPIKSALKQTEVKILSSMNNSFVTATTSTLISTSTATPAATTTPISIKGLVEEDALQNATTLKTTAAIKSLQQSIQSTNDILSCTIAGNTTNIINGNMRKSSPNNSYLSLPPPTPVRKLSYSKTASVVTWDSQRNKRRGSSFGGARTTLLLTPTKVPSSASISHHHHQHHHNHLHQHMQPISALRRSKTLRNHNHINYLNSSNLVVRTGAAVAVHTNSISENCTDPLPSSPSSLKSNKISSSPCLLQRNATVRSHHSRNSSVISRNSSRHGRIIRLEQKATKVLGVVFFTFVILWAPFFVLNLLPTVCGDCEERIAHWVFDIVTWLGYASSMVNPIFYTIFNKVFRQAFKKVLLCQYARAGSQGSAAGINHWRTKR